MKETTLDECDVAIEIQDTLRVNNDTIVSLHFRRPLASCDDSGAYETALSGVEGFDRLESVSLHTLRFVVGRLFGAKGTAVEAAMAILGDGEWSVRMLP